MEYVCFVEIIWKLFVWSFLEIEPIVVSGSCKNVMYRSSYRPTVEMSRTYRRLAHCHCCKYYIEKRKRRCLCVEIEPAILQGLKGEPSNKIGYRNRHQSA